MVEASLSGVCIISSSNNHPRAWSPGLRSVSPGPTSEHCLLKIAQDHAEVNDSETHRPTRSFHSKDPAAPTVQDFRTKQQKQAHALKNISVNKKQAISSAKDGKSPSPKAEDPSLPLHLPRLKLSSFRRKILKIRQFFISKHQNI